MENHIEELIKVLESYIGKGNMIKIKIKNGHPGSITGFIDDLDLTKPSKEASFVKKYLFGDSSFEVNKG